MKLYYVKTNGNDYIAYIENNEARILDAANFPQVFSTGDTPEDQAAKALAFLEDVEDASSWSEVVEANTLFAEWENDDIEVIAELEIEHSLL